MDIFSKSEADFKERLLTGLSRLEEVAVSLIERKLIRPVPGCKSALTHLRVFRARCVEVEIRGLEVVFHFTDWLRFVEPGWKFVRFNELPPVSHYKLSECSLEWDEPHRACVHVRSGPCRGRWEHEYEYIFYVKAPLRKCVITHYSKELMGTEAA